MPAALDPSIRQKLLGVAVPTVVSLLWRKGFRNTFMFGPRPLNPQATKFVGTAFTVRTIPAAFRAEKSAAKFASVSTSVCSRPMFSSEWASEEENSVQASSPEKRRHIAGVDVSPVSASVTRGARSPNSSAGVAAPLWEP